MIKKVRQLPPYEIGAWIGLFLLQSASVPAIFATVNNGANVPLPMVTMVFVGLALYLWRSLARADHLYTVGNIIGLLGNGGLIITTLFMGVK